MVKCGGTRRTDYDDYEDFHHYDHHRVVFDDDGDGKDVAVNDDDDESDFDNSCSYILESLAIHQD